MMIRFAALMLALAAAACGTTPPRLGVLVDRLGVDKTRVGPSPLDIVSRQFLSGTSTRVRRADVLGDTQPEQLVEESGGAGLEVVDQSGRTVGEVDAPWYLTDFDAIAVPGQEKQAIVMLCYPDNRGGGTFIVSTATGQEIARWTEDPSPGRFTVSDWKGQPAIVYLQEDRLTVRSPAGALIARMPVPGGATFRSVEVAMLTGGHLVLMASGSGYTPYQMVCIYDDRGTLVYQDVVNELAFDLSVDTGERSFVVTGRSTMWRYAMR